jgi:hypothetical protein
MKEVLRPYLWPMIVGFSLGWLLDPGIVREKLYQFHDHINPVAEIRAIPVKMDGDDFVLFTLEGVKHRDCLLDTLIAYDVGLVGGQRLRLHAARIDGTHSVQRGIGPFKGDVPWSVKPPAVGKLELYARHLCGDRHVMTPITIK